MHDPYNEENYGIITGEYEGNLSKEFIDDFGNDPLYIIYWLRTNENLGYYMKSHLELIR